MITVSVSNNISGDPIGCRAQRCANVELLRCILMAFIVLHHCYVHGVYAGEDRWWSVFFVGAIAWHVDCFVAISGWYGIKLSAEKFLALWCQIAFYSALSVAWSFWHGPRWLGVTAGWFGGTYFMLMLVAPLLNIACESLCEKSTRVVFAAWGAFAIGCALTWLPGHLYTGVDAAGAGPYSITTFVFVYVTARILRLRNVHVGKEAMLLGVVFFVAGIIFAPGYATYDAPYIWSTAILLLLCFKDYVIVSEKLSRVVRFLAPSMFGIYLLHDASTFGRFFVKEIELHCASSLGYHPCIIMVISAVVVFCLSLCVDLFRRGVFHAWKLIVRRVVNGA